MSNWHNSTFSEEGRVIVGALGFNLVVLVFSLATVYASSKLIFPDLIFSSHSGDGRINIRLMR